MKSRGNIIINIPLSHETLVPKLCSVSECVSRWNRIEKFSEIISRNNQKSLIAGGEISGYRGAKLIESNCRVMVQERWVEIAHNSDPHIGLRVNQYSMLSLIFEHSPSSEHTSKSRLLLCLLTVWLIPLILTLLGIPALARLLFELRYEQNLEVDILLAP